jgi:D-serine deaminase-like pyridoxal phosphate-dependent protein
MGERLIIDCGTRAIPQSWICLFCQGASTKFVSARDVLYNAGAMLHDLATPSILIDAERFRRNLTRLADYAKQHRLGLRPHTKTHKTTFFGKMQMEAGAIGLTVAKSGEAKVMAEVADDILMAYPAVDPIRTSELARLAQHKTVRVAIDSTTAADALSSAAREEKSTIGILVDIDVGLHRTGVQSPEAALQLAQHVANKKGLRLDGIMFYPGHVSLAMAKEGKVLAEIDFLIGNTLSLWKKSGLEAKVVSGGSTPTAYFSHHFRTMTEFRPGTYIFHDMNGVHGGYATLHDCAARVVSRVVSTAVPGQVVIDAGSKTLTSDRCGPAPDSGHGHIMEYPEAKIVKLTEEHGQVDVKNCARTPKVGDVVTVIPNHICPCINLQDVIWWVEKDGFPTAINVQARGKVI